MAARICNIYAYVGWCLCAGPEEWGVGWGEGEQEVVLILAAPELLCLSCTALHWGWLRDCVGKTCATHLGSRPLAGSTPRTPPIQHTLIWRSRTTTS